MAQERPMESVVVAVGCGTLTADGHIVSLKVVPGDVILTGKYRGGQGREEDATNRPLQESGLYKIW